VSWDGPRFHSQGNRELSRVFSLDQSLPASRAAEVTEDFAGVEPSCLKLAAIKTQFLSAEDSLLTTGLDSI
jgi:hypothetical protein